MILGLFISLFFTSSLAFFTSSLAQVYYTREEPARAI